MSFLLSLNSWGIDRESLFRRAFSSMSYILAMAQSDRIFFTSLTSQEIRMLSAVGSIAEQSRSYAWLQQQKVVPLISEGVKYYPRLYIGRDMVSEHSERIETVNYYSSSVAFGLEFSNDQELFKINEGEPIRSAMTYPPKEPANPNGVWPLDQSAIYVNRPKVNDAQSRVSFSDAVSILVHELGHKLGRYKNQEAVNSLAAKIKSYLDSGLMKEFQLSKGTVRVLQLNSQFFDEWHELNLEGRYQGVNKANAVEPFRVFDGEGFYVFYENSEGVYDLTEDLQNEIKKLSDQKKYEKLPYDWKFMHWFWSSQFDVKEEKGQIKIAMNLQHGQVATGFVKNGDPSPRKVKILERLSLEPDGLSIFKSFKGEWSVAINQLGRPQIKKWHKSPPIIVDERPEVQIKKLKESREQNDLILEYAIDDLMSLKGIQYKSADWYLVVLSTENKRIEIRGEAQASASGLNLRFKVQNFFNGAIAAINLKNIEVQDVPINLSNTQPLIRKRLFFDELQTVTQEMSATAQDVHLKSIQIWNGQTWDSIKKRRKEIAKGSHIKLIVQSESPLVDLKMLMKISQEQQRESFIELQGERKSAGPKGVISGLSDVKLISIDLSQAQQIQRGKYIEVIFQIDHKVLLKDYRIEDISPDIRDMPPGLAFKVTEENHFEALSEREILGFEISNQRMKQSSVSMKMPLPLLKQPTEQVPQMKPNSSQMQNKCPLLFL